LVSGSGKEFAEALVGGGEVREAAGHAVGALPVEAEEFRIIGVVGVPGEVCLVAAAKDGIR
jgi:hypothetical protein